MQIVFRADSSASIGTGHIMRCLTLADLLKPKGCETVFVCRDLPGNINHLIASKGYALHVFSGEDSLSRKVDWQSDASATIDRLGESGKADCLVVDNYRLDYRWQERLRAYANRIMVIDDLADRPHDCDILLDQNFYQDMDNRYQGLVPEHCRCFLGPRFVILREEFRKTRQSIRTRDGSIKRVLISFGGSDPTNETMKVLTALNVSALRQVAIDVVVGSASVYRDEVHKLCKSMPNVRFFCQTENMAQLINEADLAIGGAGTSSWERCYLGLPTLLIVLADNQAEVAAGLAAAGAGWYLGDSKGLSMQDITNAFLKLLVAPEQVRLAGLRASQIMGKPGCCGIDQLVDAIMEDCL